MNEAQSYRLLADKYNVRSLFHRRRPLLESVTMHSVMDLIALCCFREAELLWQHAKFRYHANRGRLGSSLNDTITLPDP